MFEFKNIKKIDNEVYNAIQNERKRQKDNIELIASENFVSKAVMEAMGSALTNKYAEGYPGKRYYGGCEYVDVVEDLARQRLLKLFGGDHANVQPHSGASANLAVYYACLTPGDTVLGLSLPEGGHLTHGSKVNISGKYYNFVPYGLNEETQTIDYDNLEKLAMLHKPKLIVAGASAYSRKIDFKKFKEIADKCGALLMVDMAHIAGLVAAGLHENPVPYADFVTSTTHKTLRGPRGGVIICKQEWAKKIDSAVFPGIQGGPLMHVIAGKAVCFKEALTEEFKNYHKQILLNSRALANTFKANEINLVSGGTDNHLMLLDLSDTGITGLELENLLAKINITVNKNAIPNDPNPPSVTSGIRIGSACVTTRGMKEKEMVKIANIISRVIKEKKVDDFLLKQVNNICKKFKLNN